MAQHPSSHFQRAIPTGWLLAAALASILGGAALAHGLPAVTAVPDLMLRLAALWTLPLPLLALHFLTTPPDATARRLLGEPAWAMVRAGGLELLRVGAVALAMPVGLALSGWLTGESTALRLASALATGVLLTLASSWSALLLALRTMAAGPSDGWTLVAGGGAFGPAASAPLLYLPALALVAALAPLAVLAAVWNARPEWLTPTVWWLLPVSAALAGARWAHQNWLQARPALHAGLRAALEAHATRFAQADGLAEAPVWLRAASVLPAVRFLARAWHRRWPLSLPSTWALVAILTGLLPAAAPEWVWLLLGAGVAAVSTARVLALRDEPAWQATAWLGLGGTARAAAALRLAAGLALPSLVWPLLLLWRQRLLAAGGWLLAIALMLLTLGHLLRRDDGWHPGLLAAARWSGWGLLGAALLAGLGAGAVT